MHPTDFKFNVVRSGYYKDEYIWSFFNLKESSYINLKTKGIPRSQERLSENQKFDFNNTLRYSHVVFQGENVGLWVYKDPFLFHHHVENTNSLKRALFVTANANRA